jgi:hypothetical protein
MYISSEVVESGERLTGSIVKGGVALKVIYFRPGRCQFEAEIPST